MMFFSMFPQLQKNMELPVELLHVLFHLHLAVLLIRMKDLISTHTHTHVRVRIG